MRLAIIAAMRRALLGCPAPHRQILARMRAARAAVPGYERQGYGGGWDEPRDRKVKLRTAEGCEIERKWKKGEYEEKVKCKPGRYGYR